MYYYTVVILEVTRRIKKSHLYGFAVHEENPSRNRAPT